MKKIWIEKPYNYRGGTNFRLNTYESLKPNAKQFKRVFFPKKIGAPFHLLQFYLLFPKLIYVDEMSPFSLMTNNFARKTIFAFFHMIDDESKLGPKQHWLRRKFIEKLKYARKVITIAPYWHNILSAKGIESEIIYCCYNEKAINIVRNKVRDELRNNFDFSDKTSYVYLGQCVPEKGIEEVVNCVKLDNVEFVTSGFRQLNVPTKHFFLDEEKYYELMRACDIGIFNSTLPEGWNINAMECVLTGTPALIKNHCGMGDLLRISGQPELRIEHINEQIEYLLGKRQRYVEIGWVNLKDFTFNRFRESWIKVYNEVQ